MKLVNIDLTREKIWVNVSGNQIYIEVFSKIHGKWKTETYFEDYGFEVDRELTDITVRYVISLWKLKNPEIFMSFGN